MITPAIAAAPVVLFQNIPKKEHGKYTRADKACIFLNVSKAPSPPIPNKSFQVKITAKIIAAKTVIFQSRPVSFHLHSLSKYFL